MICKKIYLKKKIYLIQWVAFLLWGVLGYPIISFKELIHYFLPKVKNPQILTCGNS